MTSIDRYIPKLPPNKEKIISVRSLMRHLFFIAHTLSYIVNITDAILIKSIYIKKTKDKVSIKSPKGDILKIRKFIPLLLSVAILIGITAFSSVKRTNSPDVLKNINTADELSQATKDEEKINVSEMRGVWISYIELSMEAESDKSEKAFRAKFDKIAKNCKGYGLNTLIVQVRPYGDALYDSKYYPWSHILTGIQGKNPGYDPLKIMCEISKKYKLQIHAWVNPYRVTFNETPKELSENNPYIKNTELGIKTESGIMLDPSSEKARELIINGVKEIVNNYDVDGIQFDDYFYPENIGNSDSKSYESYVSKYGKENSMNIGNWRKANVNMLICGTYRAIHSESENTVFGISPQGNIGNNEKLFADVKNWCTCRGFVDYICPQIYFSTENPSLTFEDSLESWCSLEFDKNVKLYVGLAGYKAGSDDDEGTWLNSDNILAEEYKILKNNKKAEGFMIYNYESLISDKSKTEMQNLRNLLN